jgi:outer membrane protein TolC
VGTLLADTFTTNPALTALVEEQQRLDAQATALARARLPRFSGGGRLDWNSQDILEPKRLEAGFVGFAWDLGTDGRREAELAAARLAADRQRLAIEAELRGLERAVRRLHRATAERLTALATADAAVAQAEENLRIREQQFAVGRATSEDVLDAEALLTRQRAGRARALYQAHVRRAELEQLTGRSLDRLYTDPR